MAVGMTAAIVLLSPVQDATPEILVRTRPNRFDLVAAVLSGAAGGYATVRRRAGAVVGVAIAAALMPPLAVAGYGLATSQWSIARGAALLFVTDMVAISATAALVAGWYGFGRGGIRRADEVVQWFDGRGIREEAAARFPVENQRAIERLHGLQTFRKVVLTPLPDGAAGSGSGGSERQVESK